ncbi:Dbl homology domain-containing protein [Paxillus ammoniavirescens]|nr:Dbl homology domain-containing protein [Paxillus ammoniavirescens]
MRRDLMRLAIAVGSTRPGQSGLELGHGQGTDGDHGDYDLELTTDVYSTPSPSAAELQVTSSDHEEENEDDADYSLDEDDTSDNEGQSETYAYREAREAERRHVLEAAGLIVHTGPDGNHAQLLRPILTQLVVVDHPSNTAAEGADVSPAPDVRLPTSIGAASESQPRKRRPAPAAPERTHLSAKYLPPLDLPDDTDTKNTLLVSPETNADKHTYRRRPGHVKTTSDSIVHPDDAFERYEAFKKMQGVHNQSHVPVHAQQGPPSANRVSVSSFDTASLALSSPPRSPTVSVTPSLRERQSGESRTSHFLGFLGRHARSAIPDNDRERRISSISAPILQTPVPIYSGEGVSVPGGEPCGPPNEGSPVFGSSWASLVDRSALEGIPKAERKRQEAIFELISTEADYVRDLQLIVGLFYSGLMGTLDEQSTAAIFSNIEDILLTNTTFLSTLEERQRDCRLYVDHIGDLLERHMPNMRVYLKYCVNQANAGNVLRSMRESNPELAAQLQSLREHPSARNLDLSSYLLVPMQRLTRYPLLIRQIMQYTDPPPPSIPSPKITSATSPPSPPTGTRVSPVPPQRTLPFLSDIAERQAIASALHTAEQIADEVNEAIRDQEGRERLREISQELWIGQGRLDLTAPTRHLGARKLLKEGVLSKAKSGRRLRAVLCSDILVLMDEGEKGLYRVPISVTEIKIRPAKTGREDPLVRVHISYPRGGDVIVLRAANVREAKAWTEAIVEAGSKAREGIKSLDGAGGGIAIGMH